MAANSVGKYQFRINGFINGFPGFIIQTKSGKAIVLETKGDHLDAEQKISWAAFGQIKPEITTGILWFMKGEQFMEHISWRAL